MPKPRFSKQSLIDYIERRQTDDTGQEIAIHANGKVVQHHAPGGKWQYIPDLRKAQHA